MNIMNVYNVIVCIGSSVWRKVVLMVTPKKQYDGIKMEFVKFSEGSVVATSGCVVTEDIWVEGDNHDLYPAIRPGMCWKGATTSMHADDF